MPSQKLIRIASIVPGLGLWMIGKHREAFVAAILFFAGLYAAITLESDLAAYIVGGITVTIWILQYYWAIYSLKIDEERNLGAGESPAPKSSSIEKIQIESKIPRLSRGIYKSLQSQVVAGESLKHAIGNSTHLIGLTSRQLILITRDFYGKPAVVYRFGIDEIRTVSFKEGIFFDYIGFDFGEMGDAVFRIGRGFRKGSKSIMNEILSSKSQLS